MAHGNVASRAQDARHLAQRPEAVREVRVARCYDVEGAVREV